MDREEADHQQRQHASHDAENGRPFAGPGRRGRRLVLPAKGPDCYAASPPVLFFRLSLFLLRRSGAKRTKCTPDGPLLRVRRGNGRRLRRSLGGTPVQRLQIPQHLLRVLVAVLRVVGTGLQHDPLQFLAPVRGRRNRFPSKAPAPGLIFL